MYWKSRLPEEYEGAFTQGYLESATCGEARKFAFNALRSEHASVSLAGTPQNIVPDVALRNHILAQRSPTRAQSHPLFAAALMPSSSVLCIPLPA